ncbi:MAG TPA: ATP-binding protein [Vitreimonas sp.]|nr:ATP-binding protein [Vitreimonas sp.]
MLSLKNKILLLTLVPVFIVLMVIGGMTIRNKSQTERQLLFDRISTYITLLESGDLSFESSNDRRKLEALLDEKVNFAQILKPDHTVIYSTENLPETLLTADEADEVNNAFNGIETIKNEYHEGEAVLEAISPVVVNNKVVAAAHLALSNDKSAQRLNQFIIFVVLLTLAGMVIAYVLISLLLDQVVIRNIRHLKEAALEMQKGNLKVRIPITTHDEIGELATAFEKMRAEVDTTRDKLEALVKERTGQLETKILEIEAEKAKDEAMLVSIGDGMIVTDKEGRIQLTNQRLHEIIKLKDPHPEGKRINDVMVLTDERQQLVPADAQPISTALQTGQQIKGSYVIDYDSNKHYVSITTTPVVKKGEIIGTITIIRDITHEKEVDRMKTEFISLASHQLRTPLSAIKWFTEMLLAGDAGKLEAEQHDFAQNIADSTERMIQLVNSLLNISRIESGRIIVDPKPTDLLKLVQTVATELDVKVQEKKHNLIISAHQDLPIINVDPQLISHVYMNLLTNAIKYTPPGGEVTVIISKKDDQIISQVTDSGYGIPKEQQHKVFQKFFRAENVVKVESDGTGLGLYLVKAVIESSGGKIWFESGENKGTTFWFSLPVTGMIAKKGEVSLD